MTKNFLFALTFIFSSLLQAQTFPSQNITLLGQWNDTTISAEPTFGIRYSGVWGWADGNGKEYAIIGSSAGYHIIEVTNPTQPVERAYIPGCRDSCIWREIKTYSHYVYCVSDDAEPNCMAIADLSYLPDSVHLVHNSNSIIERSHTIYVDGDKLYGGYVHGGSIASGYASMAVYSLANPEVPVKLRELNDDVPFTSFSLVHDMLAVNDTVYASCGFDGLYILKFDTVSNTFSIINSVTSYPQSGYNHSSAITADRQTLIVTDEVPTGLPIKAFNISNLQNISFYLPFRSDVLSTATPHNPFMMNGDKLVMAYYQDGLQIFDVKNPLSITRTGYIDTNPTDGAGLPNPNYSGCWGAYVDLPSGNILVSDMQNGLFIINADTALGLSVIHNDVASFNLFPNPSNGIVEIQLSSQINETVFIKILDVNGKTVLSQNQNIDSGNSSIIINTSEFSQGVYLVKIAGDKINLTKKLILY